MVSDLIQPYLDLKNGRLAIFKRRRNVRKYERITDSEFRLLDVTIICTSSHCL